MSDIPKYEMDEARKEWIERGRKLHAEMEQDECPHDEHDHGICLDCGKDIMDDLVDAAEMARDAAEDR